MLNSNRGSGYPKPVIKAELSEKNTKPRIILIAALLLITGAAFTYALVNLLSEDSGWVQIDVDPARQLPNSGDFTFIYNIGASGISASAEKKALINLYTSAMDRANKIFGSDMVNLNNRPNEIVTIDPILYKTFELFKKYNNRDLFLAPVYVEYKNIFSSTEDYQIYDFDIVQNTEVKEYITDSLEYIQNPNDINIELLGNNQVRVNISENYMKFEFDNYFGTFIDLFWYKNAFIVDFLASEIEQKGYTLGSLSSFNGYTKNLDNSGNSYSLDVYSKVAKSIYPAATLTYKGSKSIVNMRNYILSPMDSIFYYVMDNGEIRTPFVDIKDGYAKSSLNEIYAWSDDLDCGETLLNIADIYVDDSDNAGELLTLVNKSLSVLYFDGFIIKYSDQSVQLSNLFSKEGVSFRAELVN